MISDFLFWLICTYVFPFHSVLVCHRLNLYSDSDFLQNYAYVTSSEVSNSEWMKYAFLAFLNFTVVQSRYIFSRVINYSFSSLTYTFLDYKTSRQCDIVFLSKIYTHHNLWDCEKSLHISNAIVCIKNLVHLIFVVLAFLWNVLIWMEV